MTGETITMANCMQLPMVQDGTGAISARGYLQPHGGLSFLDYPQIPQHKTIGQEGMYSSRERITVPG